MTTRQVTGIRFPFAVTHWDPPSRYRGHSGRERDATRHRLVLSFDCLTLQMKALLSLETW